MFLYFLSMFLKLGDVKNFILYVNFKHCYL